MSKQPLREKAFVRLQSRPDGDWLVDPQLRPRLVRDATANGYSLNDQAIVVLAEKWNYEYEPKTRRTTPSEVGEELNLYLPKVLHGKISRSTKHPSTVIDTIRAALSEHYELPMPVKGRAA